MRNFSLITNLGSIKLFLSLCTTWKTNQQRYLTSNKNMAQKHQLCLDIPLNRKMAPTSDWLFFCSSSVELENNSPMVFCNWHAQTFENCCMRFYFDWRRRRRAERRKLFLPDTVCIEYFLYLLSSLEVSFELLFSIYIY